MHTDRFTVNSDSIPFVYKVCKQRHVTGFSLIFTARRHTRCIACYGYSLCVFGCCVCVCVCVRVRVCVCHLSRSVTYWKICHFLPEASIPWTHYALTQPSNVEPPPTSNPSHVRYLIQRCSTMNTCSGAFYNLGSGSWLEWANDTAAHYAAIHCPH